MFFHIIGNGELFFEDYLLSARLEKQRLRGKEALEENSGTGSAAQTGLGRSHIGVAGIPQDRNWPPALPAANWFLPSRVVEASRESKAFMTKEVTRTSG